MSGNHTVGSSAPENGTYDMPTSMKHRVGTQMFQSSISRPSLGYTYVHLYYRATILRYTAHELNKTVHNRQFPSIPYLVRN